MSGYHKNQQIALAEAERRLRHAVRESFPIINTTMTTAFGLSAAVSSGTTQGVLAGVSAVFAGMAVKSVCEDAWFWRPAVKGWIASRANAQKIKANNNEMSSFSLDKK